MQRTLSKRRAGSVVRYGNERPHNPADKLRYVRTRSRLPVALLEQATEVEQRMQTCCEYHLADHAMGEPEVERLRAGHGHRDLVADLRGYVMLYQEHAPLLDSDKKHCRACTLLKQCYGAVGRFLFRHDAATAKLMFSSLITVSRSAPNRRL